MIDPHFRETIDNINKAVEDLSRGVIVVLDDDKTSLKLICSVLRGRGEEVRGTTNQYEFFRILESNYVKAVLVDYYLCDVNGLRILQELNGAPFKKIIISGHLLDDIILPDNVGFVSKTEKRIDEAILKLVNS